MFLCKHINIYCTYMYIDLYITSLLLFTDDKLTRVRSLLEHVESISQSLFQPYESVSVDERMVASKHHYSGIRQFIRDNQYVLA